MDEHQISKNISDHFDEQFSSLLNYVSKKQGIAKGDWKYIPSNNRRRLLAIAQNKTLYDAHHRYPGVPMDTIKKIILHRSNTISHTTIEGITPDYYQTEVRPVINTRSVPEDIGDFGRRRMDRDHISRFNKHLSTNNEWFVVTDKNMNVLSSQEGQAGKVNKRTRNRAYSEARTKLPEGEQEIYAFHSHPKHYGIAAQSPSGQDLKRLDYHSAYEAYNHDLYIRAEGVMTRHGTKVIDIKYPTPTFSGPRIKRYYNKQELIRQREEAEARGITKDNYKTKTHRELFRLLNSGRDKAFSDTQQKYPELQSEFIKREIIRPSDVRPHITTHGIRDRRPVISINGEAYHVGRNPEDIGDFGKKKRQKTIIKKDRTVFHGI